MHRRLRARFGDLSPPRRLPPLEELVLTVLSQNTSDVNRDRAYRALRDRYPTWKALAAADERELAEVIRPGGLGPTKAPRILAILREVRAREGRLDLGWMHRAPSERVREYLLSLPGVGPKTAACVLAFSLGRPALPVDTHVFRVARRLGFFGGRTDPARAHEVMAGMVPEDLQVEMHVGLIRLGREVCRPVRPACPRCPLLDLCPAAPAFLPGAGARRAEAGTERRTRAAGGRPPPTVRADEGNRTPASSLGSSRSTTELHPRRPGF
jgi:endonuclease-3